MSRGRGSGDSVHTNKWHEMSAVPKGMYYIKHLKTGPSGTWVDFASQESQCFPRRSRRKHLKLEIHETIVSTRKGRKILKSTCCFMEIWLCHHLYMFSWLTLRFANHVKAIVESTPGFNIARKMLNLLFLFRAHFLTKKVSSKDVRNVPNAGHLERKF